MSLDDYDEYEKQMAIEYMESMRSGDRKRYEKVVRDGREVANNKKMIRELEAGTYKDPVFMREEEVNTAYKHALDSTFPTVDDCFDEVKIVHSVTDEYIDEVRSKPVYAHIVSKIVDENVSHPELRSMRTNKVLQLNLHKKASTPNELITDITLKRFVNDKINKFEKEVQDLRLQLESVSISQESTDLSVDKILETLELPKDHNRTKAIILKQKGYKIKNIAQVLGVNISTVKRWTQGLTLVGCRNEP
jgi:DNA-binding transcriptional regulator YiaG